MCHALLQDPKFLNLLVRIDHEFAAQCRADGCPCGGALHRADYPRKPRGCPRNMRWAFSWRLSFCCAVCRARMSPLCVRFLGQRVYLALAVVLVSGPRRGGTAAGLGAQLGVTRQTLRRWQLWWREQFPLTPLWRAMGASFMPCVDAKDLPGALLERFVGEPPLCLMRMLVFLSPLTRRGAQGAVITVFEGR